ncbi:MAG: succinylglutamate desuccinylase/aspartoacylase family protein [Alcanivoracaceae bacterium]|nr:succinylglutamate desuccinylase/aspartoacylase family protein [Alcanivoracaceae bacterium]
MITQLNHLPEGLLNLSADQLHTKLDNHTLVHLQGKIKRPVFISILQHGDEYTGWDALKDYLNNHQHILPRSLSILFGNVQAARYNVRQLDEQPDFNRSWPSHLKLDCPIATTMHEITDIMKLHKPFASVDIHNNSGRNPHYSGINSLDPQFLNLASLFSDTMIYFTSPYGIQSGAFAQFCPSVTVECGLSGTSDGTEQTHTFLELLLSQSNLIQVPGILEHQKVYKIFATVKIKANIDYSFIQHDHEFILVNDLDFLNFHQIETGEEFGQLNQQLTQQKTMPLVVTDESDNDVTSTYFTIAGNKVVCNKSFVPAMITQNIQAIRHDCLCYIMQPISAPIS